MRRELLTWDDIDMLIDHMIPQFNVEFEGMVMITRGGIVPGGLLAAALQLENILTAAVDFPAEAEMDLPASPHDFSPGRNLFSFLMIRFWLPGEFLLLMMFGVQAEPSQQSKTGCGCGRASVYLCAAFQSLSKLIREYSPGLLWCGDGCLYCLSMGKPARS